MAKRDWGQLQQQFLADHAASGISPSDWCELKGLKYSTAKAYIKIKKPNSEKTNSQKKSRTKKTNSEIRETDERAVTTDVDGERVGRNSENGATENAGILKPQHEQFAQNIAQGMPQKDAAICAGYSPGRADTQASILLRRPDIRKRIRELRQEAALLVTFNAKDLADLSYQAAQAAKTAGKFGQVAPNVKNAAMLTGLEMGNVSETDVDLAGLSYGKVVVVTPATCPPEVWAAHMDKLREGKATAQQ